MARPRSTHAHARVLDAALKLFGEAGIDATSMDAISEASGVSKATIYKHWPDKDALCLEVMATLLGRDRALPAFESGDIRHDMIAALGYRPHAEHSSVRARIMPHLVAYAARNPTLAEACRNTIFGPPRAAIAQLLDRAVAQGQLPRALDRDLAMALLIGPMMYSHLLRRVQGKAPHNLPERIVDAFWKAYAARAVERVPRTKKPSSH
jgi:AcrR family transcriptional regulator